ncbi:hypothetical protein AX774_g659 [Zancudomyces culisetae]|uniref:Uncharacterized protein n=1 Tax=Zancudomyces culisetae TaxID=1213189 RepID=A0A1R1PXT8_ZANCU|nr:hypothetical protein AX774_g659 [Zancudomyces culisetae]|eukprot:OMH85785.1 hypothetical protein AX774_g659 [Zancudomyces culisetae]
MKGKANVEAIEAMEASVDERDLEHPGALETAEKDILNAKSTAENESENQNEDNHNNESESESEGGSGNEDNSEYESSDEDTPDICARKDLPAPILERTQKLALLRQKMVCAKKP